MAWRFPGFSNLSKREREVLALVGQGASNLDVAETINISENTVKVHMRNIMERLHAHNRQQAVAWALASGILD
jgi:DNA-binding NarL/FixJ family response regulator